MSCDPQYNLQFSDDFNKVDYITEFERNLKVFLDYSLFKMGAYENINADDDKCVDLATLTRYVPPTGTSLSITYKNKIFVGKRQDWVWENDPEVSGTNVPPSVYINDSLEDSGNYEVDYPGGRVIFDSTVATSAAVTADYTFRIVQTHIVNQANWWKTIERDVYSEGYEFDTTIERILAEHRVQLPSIIIHTYPSIRSEPYCLGTKARWFYNDVDFIICARTSQMKNKLVSILSLQHNLFITLFNSDDISQFPINCSGALASSDNYPDLVDTYPWKCVEVSDVGVGNIDFGCRDLYFAKVRLTFKIFHPIKL